jgi:hypothetical protein
MTLARDLSLSTLDALVARFKLREIGAPFKSLVSPMSPTPVGAIRVFTGEKISERVTVPPIGLDSHMYFAFTPPGSLVPHFTLDSVNAGPHLAFHLDLVPRADLGANLDYLNHAFQPLTAEFDAARKIDGLTPAHLSPRQYAIMSPWMLAFRANESAFAAMRPHVDRYLSFWGDLVEQGIPTGMVPGATPESLAERDRRNRAALFNPEVDPVWSQMDRLLGPQTCAEMRDILKRQEI